MKTITFTYTKADKSTSERVLFTMVTPGNKYAGIDVTELEPHEAVIFEERARRLHDEYMRKMTDLQLEFDLKYAYRQFFADQMTQIEEL